SRLLRDILVILPGSAQLRSNETTRVWTTVSIEALLIQRTKTTEGFQDLSQRRSTLRQNPQIKASFSSDNSDDQDSISIITIMSKNDNISTATTSTDSQTRAILDTTQRQNENHERQMTEIRCALQLSNKENKKRAREIEMLSKTIASIHIGEGTPLTDDFASIMTNDERNRTVRPIHDHIGVEDFIKEVRILRSVWTKPNTTTKGHKSRKNNRKSSSEHTKHYNRQLRRLLRRITHQRCITPKAYRNFNVRFRRILNKLAYAITNEYPQPITRRVMMEATMKRVTKIYINGLKAKLAI
ncbi:unnamed protein product, partial [Heterotrigona itama]